MFNGFGTAKIILDIVQGEYGDRIVPQIENLILEAYNPLIVSRFIALQCMVVGGFKNATISAYERLFIQVSDFFHMYCLLFNKFQFLYQISHFWTVKGTF